jgi:hypothetical protein
MAKQEVSTVVNEDVAIVTYAAPGSVSFDELARESSTLPGNELLRDEDLDALAGVDMIITRAVIRKGVPRISGNPWLKANKANTHAGYVSLEIITTPRMDLIKINRARKASGLSQITTLESLGIQPESNYVINDGSTGIYRQVLAILAMQQYIQLPEGKTDGESGTTIFDTTPAEWADVQTGETIFDDSGFLTYDTNVRIRCKNGIRVSGNYNPDFPDAQTRYLA